MDARIVDGRKIARVTDDGKLKVLVHGCDGDNLVPVKVSEDGTIPVQLKGSVPTYQGLSEVVTRDQSVNLLDWSKLEPGGYYAAETGQWVANSNWRSTPLLPVKPGETYTKQSTGDQVTYWDANGDYVEGHIESNTFTVPYNPAIRYCRYPIRTSEGPSMFVKGISQPSIYVPCYEERVLAEGILITEGLGLRIVPHGTNLLDVSQIERGYWHYETGEPAFSSTSYRSPKIRVFHGCAYELNSVRAM